MRFTWFIWSATIMWAWMDAVGGFMAEAQELTKHALDESFLP